MLMMSSLCTLAFASVTLKDVHFKSDDCSGASSTVTAVSSACTKNVVAGLPPSYTTYTGTSCTSGGLLSVYLKSDCTGIQLEKKQIPQGALPASCTKGIAPFGGSDKSSCVDSDEHATANATATDITLATFDGASGTTFKWTEVNDPVMGGKSHATISVGKSSAVFNGTCAIVPKLAAPGFCNAKTSRDVFRAPKFHDASSVVDGGIKLKLRSTTPEYKGFRFAFGTEGLPHTSPHGSSSFKAGFSQYVTKTNDWQTVFIPFTDFSYDWSDYTGRCDSVDPTGEKHHCCTKDDGYAYCPKAKYLAVIQDLELWAEGEEGDFHLEVESISAGMKD